MFFATIVVYKTIHAYILSGRGQMEERPVACRITGWFYVGLLFFIIFFSRYFKAVLPTESFLTKYNLPWLKVIIIRTQPPYAATDQIYYRAFITKCSSLSIRFDWKLLIYPVSILIMLAFACY